MKNYENAMDIVMAVQLASAGVNILAAKKQSVKLLAVGMGLYFGSAIATIIISYKAGKEEF